MVVKARLRNTGLARKKQKKTFSCTVWGKFISNAVRVGQEVVEDALIQFLKERWWRTIYWHRREDMLWQAVKICSLNFTGRAIRWSSSNLIFKSIKIPLPFQKTTVSACSRASARCYTSFTCVWWISFMYLHKLNSLRFLAFQWDRWMSFSAIYNIPGTLGEHWCPGSKTDSRSLTQYSRRAKYIGFAQFPSHTASPISRSAYLTSHQRRK